MRLNAESYTGWGRVLSADGGRSRPEKRAAFRAALDEAPGPAIGALRSYGDAALNGRGPAVDMSRLDRLIAFDPVSGLLEAEAGVRLGELLRIFAPRGWMPAVLPGTGFATLGGAIAADVHGKNHHEAGSFGQHVQDIDLAGPDGEVRRLTEDDESGLFRATFGGMGLTGIVASARLRMAPCPSGSVVVKERRIAGLADYVSAFDESTATFSVGWIDAAAGGPRLGRGILEEAEFTSGVTEPKKPKKSRAIPFDAPGFALSSPVVRAFNTLYFRRIPAGGRSRIRPLADFFFPLDRLSGWNRLYGKRGFHQFQCVVPPDSALMALDSMLRDIARSGLAAPLAVIKKMGPGRAGPLSFPMEGYTLAVDFPNRAAARTLIENLIGQTIDAGGRIYLAKDSLATAGQIAAMYPELGAFREKMDRADPGAVFETDLARRLQLREGP